MLLKYIILCTLVFSIQGAQYYYLSGDTEILLECTYGEAREEKDRIIQAEEGYKILITMKSVDIDGGSGDFLLVKSGTTLEDGLTGRIFTYFINDEKEYISLTESVLLRFEIFGETEDDHIGYILTAQHYGEQRTTPVPSTTDVPWPTPPDEESASITVNMNILKFDNNTIPIFQNVVVQMATDYVAEISLELAEAISVDNVQIERVIQCPRYWPDMDTCIQITFALPLLLSEDSEYYGSYQLNQTHLNAMWKNAEKYFDDPYYGIYSLPDSTRLILIWLSVICSTSILFGIFYLITGYKCSSYVFKKKQKELELKNKRSSGEEKRSSLTSLSPHPLQSVPPLFDSDMIIYDPDSSPYDQNSSPPFLRSPGRGDLLDERERGSLKRFTFDAENLEGHTDT